MKQRCISRKILICCLALGTAFPAVLRAQFEDRLYRTDYRPDPARTGELRLGLENLSFFQDNEFTGAVMPGYTLPGLWLQPKLTFQPLDNIRLELGLHALIYHGAYEYPNYSYRDIASWKGAHFQHGAHLLPYFRVQVQMRRLQLVLGSLYRGSNHLLAEPLYSPELNLTADPDYSVSSGGVPVCRFSIAVNRRFASDRSSEERNADFFRVVTFRKTAEHCGSYLAKGRKVAVAGSIQINEYTDREGNRRTGNYLWLQGWLWPSWRLQR